MKLIPNDLGVISALIVGEKAGLNSDLKDAINKVGISHLFVISGLHMDIIRNVSEKILVKCKVIKKIRNYIILIILSSYYVVAAFSVSILRIIIGYLLSHILIKTFMGFSRTDKLSLNATIQCLIEPTILFSYSFLLSYSVVFGILLASDKLKKDNNKKNKIINSFIISFTSVVISLPIVVNISSKINLLSLLYNLFFIPFVTFVLLPISFLTLLIPFLKVPFSYLIYIFLITVKTLGAIDLFVIQVPSPSIYLKVFYYLFVILLYKKVSLNRLFANKINADKIIVFFFFITMFLFWTTPKLKLASRIIFLDLPSGDATLIIGNNNQVTLIDTGDLESSELENFLLKNGIYKIDHCFITHSDSDHIGGLLTLNEKIKFKNIYLSYYDKTSSNKLKNLKSNIIYLKEQDIIKIGNASHKVLWPNSLLEDVNNNSLVLFTTINEYHLLFTGDIEKETEQKIGNELKKYKIDILKVAHHASSTSTTEAFLDTVKPKVAVAMNGYKNKFSFPSKIILERFKTYNDILFLNTLYEGSIEVKMKKNILYIETTYNNKYKIVF